MTEHYALKVIATDVVYSKKTLRKEFEKTESAWDKGNSIATIFCLFSSEAMKKSHLKGKEDEERTKQRPGRATNVAN